MREEAWIRRRTENVGPCTHPGTVSKARTRAGENSENPLKGIAVASHPNCPLGVKGISKDPARGGGLVSQPKSL